MAATVKSKPKRKPVEEKLGTLRLRDNPFGEPTVWFGYPAYVKAVRIDPDSFAALPGTTCSFRIKHVHEYNSVRNAFLRSGVQRTESKLAVHVLWDHHLDYLGKLQPFQRCNHFPGSWALGRKDCLGRNINRHRRLLKSELRSEYSFFPETFVLPEDRESLLQRAQSEQKRAAMSSGSDSEASAANYWIVKPCASSCGRGIRVLSDPASLVDKKKKCVVQRYIGNPLTINGFKFDMRIYVLVTCFDPLRVYMFDNGLARFSTQPYSTSRKSLKNTCAHLTNFSINKRAAEFVRNTDASADGSGSKWSVKALKAHLNASGVDAEAVFARVERVVIKTLIAVEGNINAHMIRQRAPRTCCFELFGFDILLDDELQPHLLEVNISPSLSSSSPLDKQIKVTLMADTFHLIGVQPRAFAASDDDSSDGPGTPTNTAFKAASRASRFADDAAARSSRSLAKLQGKRLDQVELSAFDLEVLREAENEMSRLGHFRRIFPTREHCQSLSALFASERYSNVLMARFVELNRSAATALLAREVPTAAVSSTSASSSLGAMQAKRVRAASAKMSREVKVLPSAERAPIPPQPQPHSPKSPKQRQQTAASVSNRPKSAAAPAVAAVAAERKADKPQTLLTAAPAADRMSLLSAKPVEAEERMPISAWSAADSEPEPLRTVSSESSSNLSGDLSQPRSQSRWKTAQQHKQQSAAGSSTIRATSPAPAPVIPAFATAYDATMPTTPSVVPRKPKTPLPVRLQKRPQRRDRFTSRVAMTLTTVRSSAQQPRQQHQQHQLQQTFGGTGTAEWQPATSVAALARQRGDAESPQIFTSADAIAALHGEPRTSSARNSRLHSSATTQAQHRVRAASAATSRKA